MSEGAAVRLLKRLHAEASPGPWEAYGNDHVRVSYVTNPEQRTVAKFHADARAVAVVRTLLPELIALVEAAEGVSCCSYGDHGGTCSGCDTEGAMWSLNTRAAGVDGE